MKEVTVRSSDLKLLIEKLFEGEAMDRSKIAALFEISEQHPALYREFGFRTAEGLPEARRQIELRYRDLMHALESGENISAELARFLSTN